MKLLETLPVSTWIHKWQPFPHLKNSRKSPSLKTELSFLYVCFINFEPIFDPIVSFYDLLTHHGFKRKISQTKSIRIQITYSSWKGIPRKPTISSQAF